MAIFSTSQGAPGKGQGGAQELLEASGSPPGLSWVPGCPAVVLGATSGQGWSRAGRDPSLGVGLLLWDRGPSALDLEGLLGAATPCAVCWALMLSQGRAMRRPGLPHAAPKCEGLLPLPQCLSMSRSSCSFGERVWLQTRTRDRRRCA